MLWRSPKVWTILCVGDLHGSHASLERVLSAAPPEVDAVLLTGDFLDAWDWRPDRLERIFGGLRTFARPFLFVPGNHDPPRMDMRENVDRRVSWVGRLAVFGIGGANTRFGFPYEWSDASLQPSDFLPADILLSHVPPHASALDLTKDGRHVGSKGVADAASKYSLVVCGHVHEGRGVEHIGDVPCYNCGSILDERGQVHFGIAVGTPSGWKLEEWTL